jgi:hypothetical protein
MCCWHELSSLPMALVSYVNIPALTDGAFGFAVCLGCWYRSTSTDRSSPGRTGR